MTTLEHDKGEAGHKANKKKSRQQEDKEHTMRFLAVSAARTKGVKWAAEKVGRSVRTIYRWMKRFAERGREGLRERSRRPHNVKTLDLAKRQKIIDIRLSRRIGCEKIAFDVGCSSSTVHKVLKRLSLVWDKGKRTRWKFYERKHTNSLWQLDYTQFRDDLWLLLIIDDHSRFVIGHRFMATPQSEPTIRQLEASFSKYGVPEALLTDHGSQFHSVRGGTGEFDRFCLSEAVRHILASIRHPQTSGKLERKNGVLKEWLAERMIDPASFTNEEVRELVDYFVEDHNYSRPHFAYQAQEFYGIGKRRKVLFLPFLRFACHR